MDKVQHDAFWSYAHEDNTRQHGKVLELAKSIGDEYALNSGHELNLFLDRKDIHWGEKWRSTIDEALGAVPIFIAVVTPKYIQSTECRRELIAFHSAAKARGMEELLLPILYLDVPELSEDSQDKVNALLAQTQYFDWRHLRNKKPDAEEFLDSAQTIALELNKRRNRIAPLGRALEIKTAPELQSQLIATMETIDEKFDVWLETVEYDKVAGAQWGAALSQRLARLERLKETKAPRSAHMTTIFRLGSELLPIAQNRLEKARNYSKITIELDPYIQRAISLVQQLPNESPRLNAIRDGVNEAYLNIEAAANDQGYIFPPFSHGDNMRKAESLMNSSMVYVSEGNEIVLKWRDALKALDDSPITTLL